MLEIKIIDKITKYPAHLGEGDGDSLVKIFDEKPIGKSTVRKFSYEYNGYKYYLLEELLVEENLGFDDVKKEHLHIIGRNFFLDREKI